MLLSSHILCNYPAIFYAIIQSIVATFLYLYGDFSLLKYSLTFPSNLSGKYHLFVLMAGYQTSWMNESFRQILAAKLKNAKK